MNRRVVGVVVLIWFVFYFVLVCSALFGCAAPVMVG
jgi:hypothetical protein